MGGRRSGEHRNHRVPTRAAADRSGGGGPPSRSPRLTVMGDLNRHSKLVQARQIQVEYEVLRVSQHQIQPDQ